MLNKVEKLEKMVFSGGNFTVKTTVILGRKSSSGGRLDPIYSKNYPSRKYNDRENLQSVSFNQNEYLVFGYNFYDNQNPKNSINEEIYISYPHMNSLLNFMEDCYNLLSLPDLFTNNSVAVKYKDTIVESDEFVSGKRMMAVPEVWENFDQNNNKVLKKGLLLFLNSEEAYTELDLNAISSLLYIVSNYNLSIECNQLLIMGMLNELSEGETSVSTPRYQNSPNPQGRQNNNSRGLFRNNPTNRRRGLGGNKSNFMNNTDTPSENVEEQVSNVENNKRISMNDIMNTASEIDIEDIDDVEI